MFLSEDSKRDYTKKLTDKFLACGMDQAQTRERVLALIPSEIKQRIVIGETDRTIVQNIVQKCIDFPDGVEQLAFALRTIIGGTMLLGKLDVFIQEQSHMPISYTVLRELLDYVNYASDMEWPEDVLKKAYRRCSPENWSRPDPFEETNILALMVRDLTSMGCHNSTFPVLEFVDRLALYAQDKGHESVHEYLQDWVKRRAFKLNLDDSRVSEMRTRIAQEDVPCVEKVPYLLVMLDTESAMPEATIPIEDRVYNVQAWLVDEVASLLSEQIVLEDTPRKLGEVPQLLGYLIERYQSVDSLTDSIDNLVIEFLVPNELLDYGFDTWQVQVEDYEFELGIEYHVVVRSVRRATATNPGRRSAWEKKWEFLQKALKAECAPEDFVCICGPEGCQVRGDSSCAILFCSRAECQEKKRLQAVLRRSPIVYLALAHTDSASSARSTSANGNHVFQTIIHAGMPVALLPRKRMSSAESIKSLLSHSALASLPEEVWKWRKNAVIGGEESVVGQQLSLLWDDPFRLPPTVSHYVAPTGSE